jgi:hypothetical protein
MYFISLLHSHEGKVAGEEGVNETDHMLPRDGVDANKAKTPEHGQWDYRRFVHKPLLFARDYRRFLCESLLFAIILGLTLIQWRLRGRLSFQEKE